MKLVKIQDKYMINPQFLPEWKRKLYDGNACHYYVFYDEKTKKGIRYRLLATSHYYDPDKVTQVRKKRAIKMKFKGCTEPTTVTNVRYHADTHKRQFSPQYHDMVIVSDISPYQEKRIRSFLKSKK